MKGVDYKQFKNKLLRYKLETTESSVFMCFNRICFYFGHTKKRFTYKILIRNFLKATYFCTNKKAVLIFFFNLYFDVSFKFKYVLDVVKKKFFFSCIFSKKFMQSILKKAVIFNNSEKIHSLFMVVLNSISQLIMFSRYVLFDGLYITGYARRM
jgi:hypothetical protein